MYFCTAFTGATSRCRTGIIAGLGEYHGKREFDAEGRYLLPGLIDSHMHVESSLLPAARIR